MSVEAIAVVLHHSRASGTDKVILIGIANHDGDGGAWPKVATLAKYACVTERGAQKAIARLVELGELVVHAREGGDRRTRADQRPNLYEILVRCPEGCDGTTKHEMNGRSPRSPNDGTPPRTPRARSEANPRTPREAERGEPQDRNEVNPRTPEPSFNHPGTEKPSLTPPTPLALEGITASPPATGVSRQAQIDAVFQAWRTATGRSDATKLDGKRTALIARQLRLYPVEDLCDAVRGWRHFPHNRGETNGTRYDGLDLCLRDAEHIERFRDAERGALAPPELTGMARIRAMATGHTQPAPPPRFGQIIDVAAS